MTKIININDDIENFQGFEYEYNIHSYPIFDGLEIGGGVLMKGQADGTISFKSPLHPNIKTSVDINVTSGSSTAKRKNISTTLNVEDSNNAFQPLDTDIGSSILNNNKGVYELQLDFYADSDRHTESYRSKSQTGIDNVRIQIYEMVNVQPNVDLLPNWNEVISGSWWRSKRPVWQTRTRNEIFKERIEPTGNYDLSSGNISLSFNEGVTFENGKYYRVVISGDNAFSMDGNSSIADPVNSGNQFFPYVERSYRNISYTIMADEDSVNESGLSNYDMFVKNDYLGNDSDGTTLRPA